MSSAFSNWKLFSVLLVGELEDDARVCGKAWETSSQGNENVFTGMNGVEKNILKEKDVEKIRFEGDKMRDASLHREHTPKVLQINYHKP